MPILNFEESRSDLIRLRKLVETSCPPISELTQLKADLEPQDLFFREKLNLIDSAIYTQEKSR